MALVQVEAHASPDVQVGKGWATRRAGERQRADAVGRRRTALRADGSAQGRRRIHEWIVELQAQPEADALVVSVLRASGKVPKDLEEFRRVLLGAA